MKDNVNLGQVVDVWESYGHGQECTGWKTKELAESHDFYSIEFVSKSKAQLSESELKQLEEGQPIYL